MNTPTRWFLSCLAYFGHKEAKRLLMEERRRKALAWLFVQNLTVEQKKLPLKKLLHKFAYKYFAP